MIDPQSKTETFCTISGLRIAWEHYHKNVVRHTQWLVPCGPECDVPSFLNWLERQPMRYI